MLSKVTIATLFLAALFLGLCSPSLADERATLNSSDIPTTLGSIAMPLLSLTPVVYVAENGWLYVKPGHVTLSLVPCEYTHVDFYCMNARKGPPPTLLGMDVNAKDGFKAGHTVFPDSFLNYWAEGYAADGERYFSNTLIVRTVEPVPSDESCTAKH
jgi:hypothetical protein